METYEQYIKRTGDTIPKSIWEAKQLNLNRKANLSSSENKTLGKYQQQTDIVKEGSRQDKINKGYMTESGVATGKTQSTESSLDFVGPGMISGAVKLGAALSRPVFIKAAKPVANILAKQIGTKVNPVKGAYKFVDDTVDSSGKIFKPGDVVQEASEEIKVSPLKYIMNKNKIKNALNEAGDESAIVTTSNPLFKRTGNKVEGDLVDLAKRFGGASQKQGEKAHSYTGVNMGELNPNISNLFTNLGKRGQYSAALHFRKEGGLLFQDGGINDQTTFLKNKLKQLYDKAGELTADEYAIKFNELNKELQRIDSNHQYRPLLTQEERNQTSENKNRISEPVGYQDYKYPNQPYMIDKIDSNVPRVREGKSLTERLAEKYAIKPQKIDMNVPIIRNRKKPMIDTNVPRAPKKFKSGSNLGSMFGGYATTALSQAPNFINNPNAPKTSTAQDLGRQVGNQALNKVNPLLGAAAQLGQQFADKLGNQECDPVTGECVDTSSNAAQLGKQGLDPMGSAIGMGEDLLSGRFEKVLSKTPIGMLTGIKDTEGQKKLEEMQYRAKKRKENEYTVAQNKVNAQNLVQQQNKYKTMGDNFGYGKKGGLLPLVKYQDGGELLFAKGTAEKYPELAHLVEVGEILYRKAKQTGDPEDMRRAMDVFNNHLKSRKEKPFVKKEVEVLSIPELDKSPKIPKPNLQLQNIYDNDQMRFIQERDKDGVGFNNIQEKRNKQGIITRRQIATTNIGKPNTEWKNLPSNKNGGQLKYQNGELLNALKGKYNPKKTFLEEQIELQRPTNTKKYINEELDFDQTMKSLGKYVTGKEEMLPEEFSEIMIEKYPDLVNKLDKGDFEDKDVNLLKKKYDLYYKVKPKQKLAVYNGKRNND